MTALELLRAKVRQQEAEQEAHYRHRWDEINCLWEKCCKAEGIDVASQFVAFSRDNPYLPEYQQAISDYLALRTYRR